MNDSDETAQAAGYKAGDVIPMFLSGSTFFLSWIPAKACGNDGLAIYFMLEVLEGVRNFQGEK
jgi:hypothetical protein